MYIAMSRKPSLMHTEEGVASVKRSTLCRACGRGHTKRGTIEIFYSSVKVLTVFHIHVNPRRAAEAKQWRRQRRHHLLTPTMRQCDRRRRRCHVNNPTPSTNLSHRQKNSVTKHLRCIQPRSLTNVSTLHYVPTKLS